MLFLDDIILNFTHSLYISFIWFKEIDINLINDNLEK